MICLMDGVIVIVDSMGILWVEFNQWGNWWWRCGIGMGLGYDIEVYEVDSKGYYYFLMLRQLE